MTPDLALPTLCRLTADLTRRHGLSAAARREERVRSVWGNLACDRPGLTIEEVRAALDPAPPDGAQLRPWSGMGEA